MIPSPGDGKLDLESPARAGLAVAIPALFSYSYLNARITSALNGIRRFIDEFITRIAEAYPTADDS